MGRSHGLPKERRGEGERSSYHIMASQSTWAPPQCTMAPERNERFAHLGQQFAADQAIRRAFLDTNNFLKFSADLARPGLKEVISTLLRENQNQASQALAECCTLISCTSTCLCAEAELCQSVRHAYISSNQVASWITSQKVGIQQKNALIEAKSNSRPALLTSHGTKLLFLAAVKAVPATQGAARTSSAVDACGARQTLRRGGGAGKKKSH